MTGVRSEYRDRGVGRMLKLFQRSEALGRGIRLIQWTFDPLEVRNAHFNLNRLGAICREYQPNLYGVTTSPLHRSMETDGCWRNGISIPHASWGDRKSRQDPVEAPAVIEVPAELERWQRKDHQRLAPSRRACEKNLRSGSARVTRQLLYALGREPGISAHPLE